MFIQQLAELNAGILDPAIRVEDQLLETGRFLTAMSQAGTIVSTAFNDVLKDQPPTFQSQRAIITVRYNQPFEVRMYVKPDTHTRPGPATIKFRLSKLGLP